MDEFAFGAAINNNNKTTPSSWKHIGGTSLEFGNSERTQYGSLECSISCCSSVSRNAQVPKRFLVQRIVPWRGQPPQDKESLLLKENNTKELNQTLDMTSINAMLLSVESAMVFQDADDSCRTFVYIPRSLHTASLMEYNTNKTSPTKDAVVQERKMKKAPPKRVVTNTNVNVETKPTNFSTSSSVQEKENIEEPAIEAVEPEELEKLYQACLDTNEPTPLMFRQIVVKSLLNKDGVVDTCCKMLVSSFQIQTNAITHDFDNPRLLPLQVGIRLALCQNTQFLKHHHQVTYKSALSKKSRKTIKKTSPQKVLEEQVLNLLSLLAIRCSDSPADFRELVQDLCVGISPDLRHLIFDHFDLNEQEEEEQELPTTNKKRVPAVTPAATTKMTVMDSFLPDKESCLTLPDIQQKKETDDILKQKVSLTQSRSTRKNSLVPNQKRKYVGSHFGAGLSNVSSLFRQVQVPKTTTAVVASKRTTTKPMSIRLEPRRRGGPPPFKRPRTIAFERAKQVITETPAKKLNLYASPHSFSPMPGGSNSQNARRVAQEALAASRRKL